MEGRIRRVVFALTVSLACIGLLALPKAAHADGTGEFSLQVSPSPLVTTVKPGQATTTELKIRNAGPQTEHLSIVPRTFKIDPDTQKLDLDDTKPPEFASWIQFGSPTFAIQSGQTVTQKVIFNVPKDAGFSYSFALMIHRTDDTQPKVDSGRVLKGSVAIFALINVDRPGAVRSVQVAKFAPTQKVYEYLPADFQIEFNNNGNTIVQPAGNIFIQRDTHDKTPIDTLAVNSGGGYILPGTKRSLHTEWNNGFPVVKTTTADTGATQKHTDWNWSNLSNLRFGKYTAKLVAIYNDGTRDIPVESDVTFWVIPWKFLLVALAIVLLIGFGLWSLISKIIRITKRIKH